MYSGINNAIGAGRVTDRAVGGKDRPAGANAESKIMVAAAEAKRGLGARFLLWYKVVVCLSLSLPFPAFPRYL